MVYFTYPETSKITLEEVSVIFDGKQAVKNDLFEKHVILGDEQGQSKSEKNILTEHREII
ncbi:hypothetical protein MMC19_002750 [Ptychographa xylographoides]|nr:hypothetical protein [Ptychographa xylographoides]